MTVAVVVVVSLVLLGAGMTAARVVSFRTRRIEHAGSDRPERVHRLQRLLLIVMGCDLLGIAAIGGVFGAVAGAERHHPDGPALAATVGAAGIVGLAVAVIISSRTIRRAIANVRGTELNPSGRRRQIAAGTGIALFWVAAVVVANLLLPRHGPAHLVGLVAVYVVAIVVLVSVVAPLLVVRISSKPVPDDVAERLARLAAEAGVRVRAFRVLDTRGQKIANAAQMGTIPGFRYVLITDYLLEHLSPRQVDAVVAHELCHARRHHILVKISAVAAVWLVLEAAAVGVRAAAGHELDALLVLPVLIAVPLGVVLTQGLLGVRLEKAADDHAAQLVGRDDLAAALERIGQLNDTKRNTGRGWALITQHPGLDDRLRRLRSSRARGSATPA